MILNFEQLKSITLGAVGIEELEDGVHFHRFTPEQTAFYTKDGVCNNNVPATSGIKFRFRTDSKNLSLTVHTTPTGTRNYFAVDVLRNGIFFDDIRNYEEAELMRKYVQQPLPCGEYQKDFDLGEGEKELLIHLPWDMVTVLKEFRLDDGASLIPVKPAKKLLCFGDSITQGYDVLHPSRKYTSRLADYLDMEEFNKAIGGEKFQPALAACREDFTPDIITVAYGTNDWRRHTKEMFDETCRGFYKNLSELYPNTPIFAITPLWRKLQEKKTFELGPFRHIHEAICQHTADLPNVTVIDGFDIIPHFSDYFADLTLHPNGAGFDRYFEGLKPYFEQFK